MKHLLTGILITTFAIPTSFAGKQKTANKKLIKKADYKEEKRRTKIGLKAQKTREAIHRRVYKTWSKEQKANDPWTTWHRKRIIPALLQLSKMRKELFANSLFDNYVQRPKLPLNKAKCSTTDFFNRRIDGTCNDMNDPMEGAAWTRMGRNTKSIYQKEEHKDLFYPDPRKLSIDLLTRDKFKPVSFLNLFAVSWIQFMTHDWFSHGVNEADGAYQLMLEKDDPLRSKKGMEYLLIQRSRNDETRTAKDEKLGLTYLNENTHWWDGSQIYASDKKRANSLRSFKNGKLTLDKDGLIPQIKNEILGLEMFKGMEKTGFSRNWWLGLNLLHNIFVKEHNAIADALSKAYPKMNDEQLYQKARMINAALMAKIHTIEWTPAILPNTTLEIAMNANWKGLVNGSYKVKKWYELFKQDILFGVQGGKTNDAGVPFHLTEEFTSVYRMHSLLPDNVKVFPYLSKTEKGATYTLNETREVKASKIIRKHDQNSLMYSFGRQHPGALVLNNVPKAMQEIEVPFAGLVGKGIIDIGAIDIFRDRERGVPRYNEVRRQIGLKPIKKFEDLTNNKEHLNKLKKLYNDDIEAIDLLIGCLAESYRPVNYGFGETAFQIFIAMASRRLMTDRFFTESYNAKTYTKLGIKWIDDNNFKTVLLRHYPKLEKALFGVKNAFNPWNEVK
ncbi:MAG: hypothetical protein N4A33_05710 [Bacteriovoracaceae bacterium]|jgi:hypothetical protein|nr:hypothetical protein [Bacteriovoracaceae bacterium]